MLNKTWIIFSVILLTTIFAAAYCVKIPSLFVCENTIQKEVLSANGKFKALIYSRGCGTATGFMTVISILPANEMLSDEPGDYILFAEDVYREFSYENGQEKYGNFRFDVKWFNDEELLVYYTESKNLSKSESYKNIKIKYELISK